MKRGLLLIVDGPDKRLFDEQLIQGDLPNISKYIYERAIVQPQFSCSSIPSSTSYAMQSIATGRFPHDPGANYYVRESGHVFDQLWRDNFSLGSCSGDTIFHDFIEHREGLESRQGQTMAVNLLWEDGAIYQNSMHLRVSWLPYLKGRKGANEIAVARFNKGLDVIRDVDFASIYFPTIDMYTHRSSKNRLKGVYRHFDSCVENIVASILRYGDLDEWVIGLISDHGCEDIVHHENPNQVARNAGFHPRILRSYSAFDSVVLPQGFQAMQIYSDCSPYGFCPPISERDIDQRVQGLMAQDCVDIVSLRKNGVVVIYGPNGAGELRKVQDRFLLTGNPLGYSNEVATKLNQGVTEREALSLTHDHNYPDIVGFYFAFAHRHAGDLICYAAEGYGFSQQWNFHPRQLMIKNSFHKRQHGAPRRDPMGTIFTIAGSDMEPIFPEYARTIDMRPSMLAALGKSSLGVVHGTDLTDRELATQILRRA